MQRRRAEGTISGPQPGRLAGRYRLIALEGGRGRGRVCTFLARCRKRAGLIGPDTNKIKPDGQASVGGGGGGGGQYLRKG